MTAAPSSEDSALLEFPDSLPDPRLMSRLSKAIDERLVMAKGQSERDAYPDPCRHASEK